MERFTILGWIIDTRRLLISLPPKKFKRWNKELGEIIHKSVIGRLNHAASVCPLMRYFLGRIRSVLTSWDVSKTSKKVERYLSSQVLENLQLWRKDFLPTIATGMSLNLITYRHPTFLCWSDACPEGMGGFDYQGNSWRYQIPAEFQESLWLKNNCLEFVAMILTVWQAILLEFSCPDDCFLSLGDNSSAVGWLHKASVDSSKDLPLFLASRKFAQIMLTSNSCLYSQHIPGVSNTIADALSHRFDLMDDELTQFVNSLPSNQVQKPFRILPLHPEINSWMIYWMQNCKGMKGSHKIPETKKVECGDVGANIHNLSESSTMSGCPNCSQNNVPMLLEPSPQLCGEESFLDRTRSAWLRQQSKRPWQNWVRSLGQTWGSTPHMETDLTSYTPYLPDNSRGCKI
jgi:hypothetical protein